MKNRWLSQHAMRILKWRSERKAQRMPKKKNVIFWSLTPKDDLDLHIYEQAIDYAFEREDIHNIAISGAYGAGKSSIIASYKKKHPRLKFMHISLAHYQPIVRFIYLLRDDIYTTKDRTKFFDFIIPVIPVIDASNSYNKLKEMLEKADLMKDFDDSFLQGISLYIDDMRLLQNIVNEFTIYYDELKSTEPNANNMLAMITYKNLFPKDFSDLQLGRGYVASLFANKHLLIEDRQNKLKTQIEEKEDRIKQIDEEIAKSEQEIDKIYSRGYSYYERLAGRSER